MAAAYRAHWPEPRGGCKPGSNELEHVPPAPAEAVSDLRHRDARKPYGSDQPGDGEDDCQLKEEKGEVHWPLDNSIRMLRLLDQAQQFCATRNVRKANGNTAGRLVAVRRCHETEDETSQLFRPSRW